MATNTSSPAEDSRRDKPVGFSEFERRLLICLQVEFPLDADPYGRLAGLVGSSREEVYERVSSWRRDGLIRRLGPIYHGPALGRRATLCAARCPAERVEEVAGLLGADAAVGHAYLRCAGPGEPNLWFTVSAPSAGVLAERVGRLERVLVLGPLLDLPTLRVFKVRAVFDVGERTARVGRDGGVRSDGSIHLKGLLRRVVASTQAGLPEGLDPYGEVAERVGVGREDLVSLLRSLLREGVVRRVGAVLDQRRLGLRGNCLVAWRVEGGRVEEVGQRLAREAAISHCCLRRADRRWPYNLYTMLHTTTDETCRTLVGRLAEELGQPLHLLLFTQRELKRTPPRLVEEGE